MDACRHMQEHKPKDPRTHVHMPEKATDNFRHVTCHLPCFVRGLSLNLGLTDEARLTSQIFPGTFCFFLPSGGTLSVHPDTWHFLLGSMD